MKDILKDKGLAKPTKDELLDSKAFEKEQYLRYVFLRADDKFRYGKLLEDLENKFTQGMDNYPKNSPLISTYLYTVNILP